MQSGSSSCPVAWRGSPSSTGSSHRRSVGRRIVGLCVVVVVGRRDGGSMGSKRCGGYSGCGISRLGEFAGVIRRIVIYAMFRGDHGIAYGHSSLHLGVGAGSI